MLPTSSCALTTCAILGTTKAYPFTSGNLITSHFTSDRGHGHRTDYVCDACLAQRDNPALCPSRCSSPLNIVLWLSGRRNVNLDHGLLDLDHRSRQSSRCTRCAKFHGMTASRLLSVARRLSFASCRETARRRLSATRPQRRRATRS